MSASPMLATQRLFSYGTLQLESVQLATFGRRLNGQADQLPGYRLEQLAIRDSAVVATSGKTHHPIAVHTGSAEDRIEGAVLEVTPGELAHADAYEVEDYRRAEVTLASGLTAWAYVDARQS
ncbi:gamma-glutamylcyclotransferase family protein [Pelomonas sp. KK5]|uniref:gamma-glutamylcyclotransferase family protein n=1 Tax=Pelomonas sp. KK5 TaxID=1855730 RepID=UPI00097C3E3D|nr:gamma-glutamylcyclotransferase family protein [Pelomonas sp. KK5]